jgi:hypothetical protein
VGAWTLRSRRPGSRKKSWVYHFDCARRCIYRACESDWRVATWASLEPDSHLHKLQWVSGRTQILDQNPTAGWSLYVAERFVDLCPRVLFSTNANRLTGEPTRRSIDASLAWSQRSMPLSHEVTFPSVENFHSNDLDTLWLLSPVRQFSCRNVLQQRVFRVAEDDIASSAHDCVDAVGGVSAALGVDDVGVAFAVDEVGSDGSGDRV